MAAMTAFDDVKPSHIKIESDSAAQTRIMLDGEDITNQLNGLSIDMAPKQLPQIILSLESPSAVFDGLARVNVATSDPGPAAVAFLSAIDAGELQSAALNRPDLGTGPESLTQAMLDQLKEWANGGS